MLKNAQTYEIMTPESVGLKKSELVLGKHSGRHALKDKIKDLGYDIGDNAFQDFFKRFKDLADKKKEIFDEDIPVDAIFKSIRELIPHPEAHLQLYQVSAVTGGTDAQAGVTVRLEESGKTVTGQGSDSDTLVSSARAYIHALNKLLVKREKSAPED